MDMSNAYNGALGQGYQSAGSLTIQDGIAVRSKAGYLGYKSGSSGVATVSGTSSAGIGSYWFIEDVLFVGYSGDGTLSITCGGSVSAVSVIGYASTSSGTVTVSGPASKYMGDIVVGGSGSGSLSITNGGSVIADFSCFLGDSSGSSGTATVDGIGSTWTNNEHLYVGNSGSGTLNITNGGLVTVGSTTYVAYAGTNTGTIDLRRPWRNADDRGIICGGSRPEGHRRINGLTGIVSDVDLLFDSSHGLSQTITLANQPDQNIAISFKLSRFQRYRRPGRWLSRQRLFEHPRWNNNLFFIQLSRLSIRLDRHSDDRRQRLDVEHPQRLLRRLLR